MPFFRAVGRHIEDPYGNVLDPRKRSTQVRAIRLLDSGNDELHLAVQQALKAPKENGNSTPRRSEAKERAANHIPRTREVTSTRSNVFTNEDVVNSERDVLNLIIPELNARRANERNNGVDIVTDLGPLDVQYFNNPGLPFVDAISAGNFDGVRRRVGDDGIRRINNAISRDIYDGANLNEIMDVLQNQSGFEMYKPGKLLNTAEYPAVASVLRQGGGSFSSPTVLDLAQLHTMATETPMRDLGMSFRFNMKDSKPRAASDNYESAFVGLSPRIAKDIDITSRYFV